MSQTPERKQNVLLIGTGEYTTGYVHGLASNSDKGAGVVALTMIDLRRRGKVDRIGLVGVNGSKFPGIREHMKNFISKNYKDMNITMDTYPKDNEMDPKAYLTALDSFQKGDAVTIFTPDDTHFDIAMAAIERGLHVLVTKPVTKTLKEHKMLKEAAEKHGVLVCIEVHKRFDPMYSDAKDRIQNLGDFSFFSSYMSQPKFQLETFRSWAGKSSDISYYLNSHHIDFLEWALRDKAVPIRVTATSSSGFALNKNPPIPTEDVISLTVQWANSSGTKGTSVHTASWIAPKSNVHSQQRFFYTGHNGEINMDQAHRGYSVATDSQGLRSINPLFMKYEPTKGFFSGQSSYGYRSIEAFIDAVMEINAKRATIYDFDDSLPTIGTTLLTTAILEAGRCSLDRESIPVDILYDEDSKEPHMISESTWT